MSSKGNESEPTFILLMALGVLALIGWVLWRVSHNFWLEYVFRWLRFAEVWVVNLFTNRYGSCLDWLRYAALPEAYQNPNIGSMTTLCFGKFMTQVPIADRANYYVMSISPISALGFMFNGYIRWPAALALAIIIIWQQMFSIRHKFRTKHNLESFIAAQAKMWPTLTPILKFNPSKQGRILGSAVPTKLPIFAEALSPEEWVAFNQISVVNGIPDRDAARRAFSQQLGPRWHGDPLSLPQHIQGLLAAFALKGSQKRDECDAFLGKLAVCWTPERGLQIPSDLQREIRKILGDPALGGKIAPIGDNFAWRTTAILGILKWARSQGGVLAPAQFLWLRAVDRALWYPLNNLGRRAFHSEGAGAMAHFMAEEAAKKPLPIPRLETAIVTLNTYLHDPDKRPIAIPQRQSEA